MTNEHDDVHDKFSLSISNEKASELYQKRLTGLTPSLLVENFINDKRITDRLVRDLALTGRINLYNSDGEKLDTSISNSLHREGILTAT